MREYVTDIKTEKPCADCKDFYPSFVMGFDHRDGDQKTGIISQLMNRLSWRQLLEEIAKCDLVCANCHRIRTFMRRQAEETC